MVDKEEQISALAAFSLVKISRWELLFSYLSRRLNAEEVLVCVYYWSLFGRINLLGDFLPFRPFSGY